MTTTTLCLKRKTSHLTRLLPPELPHLPTIAAMVTTAVRTATMLIAPASSHCSNSLPHANLSSTRAAVAVGRTVCSRKLNGIASSNPCACCQPIRSSFLSRGTLSRICSRAPSSPPSSKKRSSNASPALSKRPRLNCATSGLRQVATASMALLALSPTASTSYRRKDTWRTSSTFPPATPSQAKATACMASAASIITCQLT